MASTVRASLCRWEINEVKLDERFDAPRDLLWSVEAWFDESCRKPGQLRASEQEENNDAAPSTHTAAASLRLLQGLSCSASRRHV